MAASRMSGSDEQRIINALDKVVDFTEEGSSPDQAIAKVARDQGIPRGHIPLMINAYNIGRTTRQREDGLTPAEKAATFDLASLEGVLEELYPTVPTTKAAAERKTGVAQVYSEPPTAYLARRSAGNESVMVKAAREMMPSPPAPVGPLYDCRQAMARSEKRARNLSEVRRWDSVAQDRFQNSLAKLAAAFERPGSPAVAIVQSNAQALHGDDGRAVLDHIVLSRPALAKTASAFQDKHHPVSRYPAIYQALQEVMDSGHDRTLVQELYQDLHKTAQWLDRVEMGPYRPAPKSLLDIMELEADMAKHAAFGGIADKVLGAGIFTAVADAAHSQTIGPNDADNATASAMRRMSSPEHEQTLKGIQARAMIHEMLNHDEILRGHDPYEVAHHYNRLSRYAPRLAEQPLAAVPAIRKSVQQGQLDSFDARELADTEGKLRDQNKSEVPRG